jgi:alpha-1,2-mannosyltransferase
MGVRGTLSANEVRFRVVVWGLVGALLWYTQGLPPLRCLRPEREAITDFFQDWASARFHLGGESIYADQQIAYRRYLPDSPGMVLNRVNAHPPAAILLALPLGYLDYPDAMLAWNVVSLLALVASAVLIVRQLGLRVRPWAWLPIAVLVGWTFPLWDQVCSGQFNLILLLLITLAWVAGRSDRPWSAGVCLGTAAAVKLFPGFLFICFLGRWRALVAGGFTLIVWLGLTLAVFGPGAHREYMDRGLPRGGSYRDAVPNVSLTALWNKLFAGTGAPGHSAVLWESPPLKNALAVLSGMVLLGLLGWRLWRARMRAGWDHAFGLAITAMLLVSPTVWPHYFLLLLLPLVLLWKDLPDGPARWVFWGCVAVLCLRPHVYWKPLLGIDAHNWYQVVASPWQTVAVIAWPTYALVVVFGLGVYAGLAAQGAKSQVARG